MNVETIAIPFDEELLPAIKLTSGEISCIYEHGRLRYLRYQNAELIRMIYFAVRDKDWRTAPHHIENELIQTQENGFSISYTSYHTLDEISYRADIIIRAERNTISFEVRGEALSSFTRNRIGICVHHPVKECKGTEVTVFRPDGTEYKARFPDLIKPHQPFTEVKRMHFEVSGGVTADLLFDGDIFETEDQRNWADSSYKTYSTPLAIPFPVHVNKGQRIEQSVALTITGKASEKEDDAKTATESKLPFPKIGYDCRNDEMLSEEELRLLQHLPFDHYRTELHFDHSHWKEQLSKRLKEANTLNTKLELVLFFSNDYHRQLDDLLEALGESSSLIGSVLVLLAGQSTAPGDLMELAFKKIKSFYPHMQIGYGTNGFFADLNRNQPSGNHFDFVSFSLCPQVHMSDTRSLLENLERQADLIETARSFAAGKRVHVSPITFKSQAEHDPRQDRSFGALWTVMAINNLSEADQLTFYKTKGPGGILHHKLENGKQSSLYMILKAIKSFQPKWIVRTQRELKSPFSEILLENAQGDRVKFLVTGKAAEHDMIC